MSTRQDVTSLATATAASRHPAPPTHTEKTSWSRMVGLALGLTAVLALLVTAFAWPATQLSPRDLPIVVAGPNAAATQVRDTLASVQPGAFAVTAVADESAARAAIADRQAYGAVVLGQPPTVLTASAASPVVAQLLTQVANGLAAQRNSTPAAVRIVDVAPLPTGDPRGAGLSALALPLVLGGIAIGAGIARTVRGIGRRVLAGVLTATVAGLALAGIADGWLGVLTGSYWTESGVIALGLAAVSICLIGLDAAFGVAGLGLGAAVVMLLGNPFSGMTSAPEMLPTPWGQLGQWLPPGATGSLLRSVAFFDGAAATRPMLILAGYVVVGLLLSALGARRPRQHGQHEAPKTTRVPASSTA
jgi:hypothetical protein